MSVECRVVSIGTLSRNPFRGDRQAVRTAHSTTVLVRDGASCILVDPGLPAEVVASRLDEQAGIAPDRVDAVFLTTFRPVHRRGLALFERAAWLMHEAEIQAVRDHLDDLIARQGEDGADAQLLELLDQERRLLERLRPAEDRLSRHVHLYPLPGATPGCAGLLLESTGFTTLIAGDAVATREYFEAGRVHEQVFDLAAAQSSLSDILEVADEIVPGHDNVFRVVGR